MSTTSVLDLEHLAKRLGCVPPERIRLEPVPGTATEQDLLTGLNGENCPCELVEGVLVEKAMGFYESLLAAALIGLLQEFLLGHDLGVVAGADGMMRLAPGLVRIPDVSFVSWNRLPNREIPEEPIPDLVPDLAVEVLSEGNTRQEMARKLQEYFSAGVRLVWYLDPKSRSVQAYTAADRSLTVQFDETLSGGEVQPGFEVTLSEWFARAGKRRGGA